jgi:hypothetical protein
MASTNTDSTQLRGVFSFKAVILKSGVHFFRNQNLLQMLAAPFYADILHDTKL